MGQVWLSTLTFATERCQLESKPDASWSQSLSLTRQRLLRPVETQKVQQCDCNNIIASCFRCSQYQDRCNSTNKSRVMGRLVQPGLLVNFFTPHTTYSSRTIVPTWGGTKAQSYLRVTHCCQVASS